MNDLTQMAKNLALNCGYHVFPCSAEKKMPAWAKSQGGRGFYDATTDPAEIDRLFSHPRAELIGIRTGSTSGISVLDVDVKHDEARAFWFRHHHLIPATRTFRTRSGGLHLYFQHVDGVRNSEGIPVKGIDSRGEGGYIIYWFSAGFDCLDHSKPAKWPEWLTKFFWPPAPPRPVRSIASGSNPLSDEQVERIKQRAIGRVRAAADGQRHHVLRSSARLLGGIQARSRFTDHQAIEWLAGGLGLENEKKACDTIEWGLAKGREQPLELGARG
jgi:hypothetical protein